MAQNLLPSDFVRGVITYRDFDPTQQHSRIIIPAKFGEADPTIAVIDTGSPWCVLNPFEADETGVDYRALSYDYTRFYIRGYPYSGWLSSNFPITLEAEDGIDLTVPATVFIPDLELGQEWLWPNFIGLSGFLERIRFAVDPSTYRFYFGAIE